MKEHLKASSPLYFDETGMSCNGNTYWLHSARTEELAYYSIHQKRGKEAMNAILEYCPNFKERLSMTV